MVDNSVKNVVLFIKHLTDYLNHIEQNIENYTFNINETKIIFEILEKKQVTARDLERTLSLDKGYTSRLLKKLEDETIIERVQSEEDKRSFSVSLTKKGKKVAKELLGEYEKIIQKDMEEIPPEKKAEILENIKILTNLFKNK